MYNTREVATFEGLTMDQTYELPATQVLNDLIYLKAKVAYDKELIKELNKR